MDRHSRSRSARPKRQLLPLLLLTLAGVWLFSGDRQPDYGHVLNTFIWQDYDLAPDHPRLFEFIDFWKSEIDGPLHSVRFTHRKMISPGEWHHVVGEFPVH